MQSVRKSDSHERSGTNPPYGFQQQGIDRVRKTFVGIPIHRNVIEQTMLNLVPLARAQVNNHVG